MGEKNLLKKLKAIVIPLLVCSLFLGIVATLQQAEPQNPLQKKADSMLYLRAEGKSVIEKQENPTEKPQETSEEETEKQESETLQRDKRNEETSDEADHSKTDDESGTIPGPGITSIIYFTTSIKDGETITTKSLYFSLYHQIADLVPQSTQIFVNGIMVEEIKDARDTYSVFLNEGENTVRVQVTYENEAGQTLSPYKDYSVYVDTRSLVINTSLKDGMQTESGYLTFTAKALFGQDEVDINVELDGETVSQFDGVYETALKEGENKFILSASYRGQEQIETYTVYYEPPEGLYIDTDLEDLLVIKAETGHFRFRAEALGGNHRTEFTVTLNGKKITGSQGNYNVVLLPATALSGQNNIIKMIAKDDEQEETLRFRVKYIPIATQETEPQLIYTNISDGATIEKKNPFTLEIAAEDYRGNKIYFDGVEVSLNGKKQILRDTKPYITYKLHFADGQNTVSIKLTDDDGREKVFEYLISYQQPDEKEKVGTVKVIMDANVLGKGTLMEVETDLMAADSAAHVILRALDKAGYGYQYEGSPTSNFYLAAIEKPGIGMRYNIPEPLRQAINDYGILWRGNEEDPTRNLDSLGEFDYTADSGWLIIVDGAFITESASAIDVADGSIIKVRFTLAKGMDIGGAIQGESFDITY